MAAPAAGKRKRDFSEYDAYLILHKYTPATILTALQEVAQHAERARIDWSALAAKTATGIKTAREYQMLWRYIAYGHDFVENVDCSAQPLDDESDLEYEVEPFPTPSSRAAGEASRFAKILIYGSSREQASIDRVSSEVPVLNPPNGKIQCRPSDKQFDQSHRLTNGAGLSPDPVVGNGPHKKKKKHKPWSKEEDAELMTGVHKCGEGNWLDILHKYSFDNTRSAEELSQRWTLLCKRQGTTKPANAKTFSVNLDIMPTQKTASMFIDMPMGKPGLSTLKISGPSQRSTQHHAPVFGTATPGSKTAAPSSSLPLPVPVPVQVLMPLPQVQQAPAQAKPLRVPNTSNMSRNTSKKHAAQKIATNAPSSIQAAVFAAGGRIAPQSAATKLLKASQSRKAVRVRSQGKRSSKTSAVPKSPTTAGESGTQLGSAQHTEIPNCSAPTSSPPKLQSTDNVNVVPQVNPLGQSACVRLLETERTLSATPVSGPCHSMEMDDDSTFCVVTMEDLFPEDVKQAADIVDPKAHQEIIDTKDADMLDQFDLYVASQNKQREQLPGVGKSIPMFAAAVKKTETLGSTFQPAVTSSGLIGTGNAGVLSKALGPAWYVVY